MHWYNIGPHRLSLGHNIDEMARKRTSLKMLRKQAIEEGKPIFKKLAENDKAVAVLMLFPDGNVRVKLTTKQSYTRNYFLNVKEPEELQALGELIQELANRKQLMNLLRENES